ncbi:DUF5906 domain-containing protein [Halodesulfovibrio marinisediminis]|uniref:NrS-1 polymerase-like helicase domain-containing protein n=1 Tax=Halodesulfovibrio marinisediminis DSM 17456 TaxID=1121457 RepID=A0A1N6IWT8_9BACT|nr:DUF5906 domain-containing protein [Halodesulfovibrio marinisediminis]SIO36502.1 hypothetical protein SAMN02745161_3014 [Halodesulfovibrio marinisediminis DSM 17456]
MTENGTESELTAEAATEASNSESEISQSEEPKNIIPWQLRDESYRFTGVLPEGEKLKGDIRPVHKWKNDAPLYNSPKLIKHLKKYPAYAVVGGHGDLVILNVDAEEGESITELLPDTFTTLSANRKLPHVYIKSDVGEKAYRLNRYIPMTDAEEVEWIENYDGSYEKKKLNLKPLIGVIGYGAIATGANSKIGEGKVYAPINELPIADVDFVELAQVLNRFGITYEAQKSKLLDRIEREKPFMHLAYEVQVLGKETEKSVSSSKDDLYKFSNDPLWIDITQSVTMKKAYEARGGEFNSGKTRQDCLFCSAKGTVELTVSKYRCYNPKCNAQHKTAWFLYQAFSLQFKGIGGYDWKKCTLEFAQLAGDNYHANWANYLKEYERKIQKKIAKNQASDLESALEEFNEDHFIASFGSDVRFCWETENYRGEPEVIAYQFKNFEQFFADREVIVDGKVRSLVHQWKKWSGARRYANVIFKPVGIGRVWDNDRFYNKWRGFSVQPKSGSCERILDHLRMIWCRGNKEYFNYLMTWFAHMVKTPEEKPGVAVVIKGEKGAGKSIIQEKLWKKILGAHFLKLDKQGTVTGRFNAHLEDKLMIVLEEAVWAGDKAAEGTLKSLITDRLLPVEAKGYDLREVDSYCRLFLNTNEHWAVPATRGERRFFVLKASDKKVGNEQYFGELVYEIENGGAEAFMDYLSKYEVEMSTLRHAPKTAALLEDVVASFSPVESWLYDLVFYEEHAIYDTFGDIDRTFEWDSWVPTKDLFDHFQQWVGIAKKANAHIAKTGITEQAKLTRELKRLMGFKTAQKSGGIRNIQLIDREEAYKLLMGEYAGLDDFDSQLDSLEPKYLKPEAKPQAKPEAESEKVDGKAVRKLDDFPAELRPVAKVAFKPQSTGSDDEFEELDALLNTWD